MAAITAPEASVIVGAFVLAGTVIQGVISARATRKTIGKPNGQGNVIQMLEDLITRQAVIKVSVEALANRHHDLVAEVEDVKRNLLTHMQDVKPKPRKRTPRKED